MTVKYLYKFAYFAYLYHSFLLNNNYFILRINDKQSDIIDFVQSSNVKCLKIYGQALKFRNRWYIRQRVNEKGANKERKCENEKERRRRV